MNINIASSFSIQTLEAACDAVLSNNFDVVSKDAFITIIKLLDNLIQKPNNPLFRTVKMSNAVIQTKIGNCRCAVDFLQCCGFQQDEDGNLVFPDNENLQRLITARRLLATRCIQELGMAADDLPKYKPPPVQVKIAQSEHNDATSYSFNPYRGQRFDAQSAALGVNLGPEKHWKSRTEAELEQLQATKQKLERQLHHKNPIDRAWKALPPGQSLPTGTATTTNESQRPDSAAGGSDAALLAKLAQKQQADRLKSESGFTTKNMRDLEKLKKQKVYSHASIHLQFPDGNRILGNFVPSTTIEAYKTALCVECLIGCTTDMFDLYVTPPRRLLKPSLTLEQEDLVPAAKVFVSWKKNPPSGSSYIQAQWFDSEIPGNLTAQFPSSQSIIETATKQPSSMDDSKNKPSSSAVESSKPKKKNREELLRRMMGGK
jgi:hypothetical protein